MSNINNNRPLNISPMPAPEQQTQDVSQTGTHPTTGAQVAQHPVDAQQSPQSQLPLGPKAQAFLQQLEEGKKKPTERSDGGKTERKVTASSNKKPAGGNVTSTPKNKALPKPQTPRPQGSSAKQKAPVTHEPPSRSNVHHNYGNAPSPVFGPSLYGSNYVPVPLPHYPPMPYYPPNPYYPAPHYLASYPPVYPQIPQGRPHRYNAQTSNQPMSYPKSQQRRKLTPSESERIAKLIRGPQIARDPSNAAQLDRLESTLLFSWEDVKAAIAGFVEERRRSGGGPSAETVKNFHEDYKLYFESQGSTNLFHLKYSIPHDDGRLIVKNNFNDVSVLDTEIGKLATDEALDFITDRVMGGESYADAIAQLQEFRGKTREEAFKFLESIGERKSD